MIKKSLGLLSLAMLFSSSVYAGDTTNIDIYGETTPACTMVNLEVDGNFGVSPAGSVKTAESVIDSVCSLGLAYTLNNLSDSVLISTPDEDITVSAFIDAARTDKLTPLNGISGVGTGDVQSTTLYLKAEGEGPELGSGKIIANAVVFNGTMPIVISY
ncbi:hypothetical protein [Methylovorus glucosotrophus]|uniref:Fimbrial protein n=1 Tax=Methylovorus glucosotrophus (strain SIP3-4) TaxID=582744 RepID=C6X7T9_METGS|nr:hypothetical protein [Methylovorus glucosotrophus]ACT51266.1 hypothetical protein Msip34_2024 [Methylovorus glucosotrophus SIP3-4]